MRKPPPSRQMRSICSTVATRSVSSRSASAPKGRPQRLTRKPGPSAARITRLPIASAQLSAARSASSPVWSAAITSTSRIFAGGLKKCIPTTSSGRAAALASAVTGIDEVLVASTALGRDLGELREQLALELPPLGRGFDDQLRVGQLVEIPRRRDPVREAALQRVGVGVVQPGLHARRGAELGDARAHRPRADDAEPQSSSSSASAGLRRSR